MGGQAGAQAEGKAGACPARLLTGEVLGCLSPTLLESHLLSHKQETHWPHRASGQTTESARRSYSTWLPGTICCSEQGLQSGSYPPASFHAHPPNSLFFQLLPYLRS